MRGDGNYDNEPCSTASVGVTAATMRQQSNPSSQKSELSPLRLALSSKSPSPVLSSANPILTASLNRPPVIGIDLSKHDIHAKNGSITAELFAKYLLPLRRSSDNGSFNNDASPALKLTAAARKERLRYQPCFQCPVCKKRFQRHIAMNAHFQNEHISQSSTSPEHKICRLCSYVAPDIVAVRLHLLTHHNIDLETPGACLVEPEPSPSSSTSPYPPDLQTSRKSGSPPMIVNTDSNSDLITSSSLSPERASPVSGYVKMEPVENHQSDEQEQAKDLSIRGQTKVRPTEAVNTRKRPPSPSCQAKIVKKSAKVSGNRNNSVQAVLQESDNNWQCRHCNITFPNQTLYFLHKGFHSDNNPWRCNGCGLKCSDMYDFNTHLVSDPHR